MGFNPFHFLPEIFNSNIILRFVASFVLAAFIGIERDVQGRPAGLRTNILVSLGACTFSVLSIYMAYSNGVLVSDPARIAAQIITGIGFIGAGAILKQGFNIRGLTTAASLWISASIGMACGSGYVEIGIICTLFSMVTLQLLDRLENMLPKSIYKTIEIQTALDTDLSDFLEFLQNNKIKILSKKHKLDYEKGKAFYFYTLKFKGRSANPVQFSDIRTELEKYGSALFSLNWLD